MLPWHHRTLPQNRIVHSSASSADIYTHIHTYIHVVSTYVCMYVRTFEYLLASYTLVRGYIKPWSCTVDRRPTEATDFSGSRMIRPPHGMALINPFIINLVLLESANCGLWTANCTINAIWLCKHVIRRHLIASGLNFRLQVSAQRRKDLTPLMNCGQLPQSANWYIASRQTEPQEFSKECYWLWLWLFVVQAKRYVHTVMDVPWLVSYLLNWFQAHTHKHLRKSVESWTEKLMCEGNQ